jgi:CheY-like chemotaxis protein
MFSAIGAPSFMFPCELPITVLDPRDASRAARHNLLRQWFTAIHDMPNMVAPTVADGSAIMIAAGAAVSGPRGQIGIPAIAAIPVSLGGAGMNRTMAVLRVLVVEDDALIGELLAEMLVGMGHYVCAVELTEGGAVAAAARYRPDLMIVDVQLGDGNGVDAVTTIHRNGPVPHIFVSGDISRVKLPWPGSVIIQKPYREADLARVIQRALDAPPALS